jgi:hypothetical protein
MPDQVRNDGPEDLTDHRAAAKHFCRNDFSACVESGMLHNGYTR